MAVSFVNQVSAAATSATLPSFQVGDYLVVFAYRNALVSPTVLAGFKTISTQSNNGNSFIIAAKFLGSSDTTTGTWTNATFVIAAIYRGVQGYGYGGSGSTTNVAGTSATISGHTMQIATGNSWVVYYAGSLQTTSMSTPTAQTLRSSQVGTTSMGILVDSNGGVTSAPGRTSTLGTSAQSGGGSFELIPQAGIQLNNYQFIDSQNGMSGTDKIR